MNTTKTMMLAMTATLMLTACNKKDNTISLEELQAAEAQSTASQQEEQAKADSIEAERQKAEAEAAAAAAAAQANQRPVYYVVVGSFESLQEARSYNANGPGDCDCGNVFEAIANGKRVYRVCTSCYYSKAKALQNVNETKGFWQSQRDVTPWVWENAGEARCVGAGTSNYDGSPVYIKPE